MTIHVRTRFLRERLRANPPCEDNLDLYEDLVRLEALVDETNLGAGRGLLRGYLARRHPEAFEAMARELDPGRAERVRVGEWRARQRAEEEEEDKRRHREALLAELREAAARKEDDDE